MLSEWSCNSKYIFFWLVIINLDMIASTTATQPDTRVALFQKSSTQGWQQYKHRTCYLTKEYDFIWVMSWLIGKFFKIE